MLPENREAVLALLEKLSPRIIGQEHEGIRCNCGCIDCGPSVVVAIEPAGDSYPGQEMDPLLWTARTASKATGHGEYSLGLSDFVPIDELLAMFEVHFGERHAANVRAYKDVRYRLKPDGRDRILAGLPAGVAIQDTAEFTRFLIDWGREQNLAYTCEGISLAQRPEKPVRGTYAYELLTHMLSGLRAEVYARGPVPELPFESRWLMDLPAAVTQLNAETYTNAQIASGAKSYSSEGSFVLDSQFTFFKT